jgi:hypothetical protein
MTYYCRQSAPNYDQFQGLEAPPRSHFVSTLLGIDYDALQLPLGRRSETS